MIPGTDQYFECPNCGNIVSRGTLISGNDLGTVYYSDGKQVSPMIPEFPAITRCPECNFIFWLDDGTRVNDPATLSAVPAEFLTVNEYLIALENKSYRTKDEEIFLRQSLWWKFNDRIRNGEALFSSKKEKEIWEDNLRKLIGLLDQEDVNQRLLVVEIYRNLTEYDKCKELLSTITNEGLNWIKEKIEMEVENENKFVFRLD